MYIYIYLLSEAESRILCIPIYTHMWGLRLRASEAGFRNLESGFRGVAVSRCRAWGLGLSWVQQVYDP